MKSSHLGLLSITFAVCAVSLPAAAQDYDHDRDARAITLGAQLEYGISTNEDDFGDANPYSIGFGLRMGITLDPGVYLGANFDYFMGEERDSSGPFGASASGSINVYDVLAEVGYDAWVGRNSVLRPKVGIGIGFLTGEVCASALGVGGCEDQTESGLALAPGLQFMHFFGDTLYLSLEARYQVIMIDGADPMALMLGAGLGAGF